MLKKILTLFLVFGILVCSNGVASAALTEGEYSVKAFGYGGELEITVKVEGDKITDIILGEHHESAEVIDRAFPVLKERILEANSPEVDSVSAATFSSFAIKQAVADAIKQAGGPELKIEMKSNLEKPYVDKEDLNTEILVVGGGPAGLAAAISAKQTNPEVDVTLIEKLDILGGNGKFNLNFFGIYNSEAQKAANVEDSKEKWLESMSKSLDSPERKEVWAEGAGNVDAWLRDMGIELNHYYGNRGHMTDKDTYAGDNLLHGLENEAAKLGVTIITGTKGTDFVMDGKKVIGVSVTNNNNESFNIFAKATIIATGGFASNKEYLKEYAPGYEVLNTSNQIGTTGDFVKVFEKNGMKLEHMDTISVFPNILVPERDLTNCGAGTILVNSTGKRFVNERVRDLEFGKAILEQDVAWNVVDAKKIEDNANVRKQVKAGKWLTADTFEELADLMKVDKANLLATIEAYNKHAQDKTEDEFGHTPEREYLPTGPYYAHKVEAANHMTKGGLACNEKAQALYEDGSVVEGLYGAGEVTYQSAGFSQSVIFGRIAGENAALSIQK
ncbi:MAG: FAD-dependent oxidoreductase [Christensenellaceae bacterium]|nr:FAD-dependent oxidoreductase [Christensenellaceae bacterium]